MKVRCPNPACAVMLDLDAGLMGRNHPCPACGQRITVVPVAVRERRTEAERVRAESDPNRDTMPVALALENIRSLWNVGSVFRTADGAGAEEIWLIGYTGRPPRDEITKTALGAEKTVPWREAATAADAVREMRGEGRQIVALETGERSEPIDEADISFPCSLLLGNEVAGLGPETLESADLVVRLPMYGVKESLNVAVAAGVALYALRRKFDAAG